MSDWPRCQHDGCPNEADYDCRFQGFGQSHHMLLCDRHSRPLSRFWPWVSEALMRIVTAEDLYAALATSEKE